MKKLIVLALSLALVAVMGVAAMAAPINPWTDSSIKIAMWQDFSGVEDKTLNLTADWVDGAAFGKAIAYEYKGGKLIATAAAPGEGLVTDGPILQTLDGNRELVAVASGYGLYIENNTGEEIHYGTVGWGLDDPANWGSFADIRLKDAATATLASNSGVTEVTADATTRGIPLPAGFKGIVLVSFSQLETKLPNTADYVAYDAAAWPLTKGGIALYNVPNTADAEVILDSFFLFGTDLTADKQADVLGLVTPDTTNPTQKPGQVGDASLIAPVAYAASAIASLGGVALLRKKAK